MHTIMLVDDAAFVRLALEKILTENNYEVIAQASNGTEAIQMYKDAKPDLVIMDITMPEMSGIDAVRGIKEFDPSAKIIMCSAMGQQSKILDAMTAGASDFIVKPYKEDRVISAVKKALGD